MEVVEMSVFLPHNILIAASEGFRTARMLRVHIFLRIHRAKRMCALTEDPTEWWSS